MIKNYFKIAWRNLWKHKLFSFINIMSLGLAIPFALLALIQVINVYEYDSFHPYTDRTYRVITDVTDANGSKTKYATTPFAVSDKLKTDYPFVEKATYVARDFGWELNNKLKTIRVNTLYVEPAFFGIFGFPLEKGTVPTLPNTLAITHEMAEIFFGDTDVIGKTLTHPDYGTFTITGVLKPYMGSTHFKSDVMVSMETFKHFSKAASTKELSGFTYVLVKPGTKASSFDAALNSITAAINGDAIKATQTLHFRQQTLSSISPDFQGLRDNPYIESLTDLSVNFVIALGIILLAVFNYINLTLARSLSRAKEVGIRKVSGALRYQVFGQFICEAILIAILSLLTGFFILQLMKEFIHVRWVIWEVKHNVVLWSCFILFAVFVGALAGVIPAKILSGFQPIKVLKGTISPASFGKIGFRKGLVVLQFVVTACFIFLMANMYSQLNYMATDNTNFNRKNIYNISAVNNYALLKNDIEKHKDVATVGMVSTAFGGTAASCGIKNDQQNDNVAASYYAADAGFISNMNLQIIAGKNLPQNTGDSASAFVLVNEEALFATGLGKPQEAIGKQIILNDTKPVIVYGVLKSFCYYMYQFAPQPLVIQYNPAQFHVLSIKTKTAVNEKDFKADMGAIWKKYSPYADFAFANYEKDLYERYYPGADMKFMGMVGFIVFIIAIMGLIGMVTYNTEKRIKEIGIRKVMGASVAAIVRQLSAGFVKLIVIAAAICIPLGYLSGYFFVKLFAFNNGVNLPLMLLLFAGIFLVALLTIVIKTIKAASVNPVNSLRTE
ncbi:ABC transporter permease [Ferruginibacter sp.]